MTHVHIPDRYTLRNMFLAVAMCVNVNFSLWDWMWWQPSALLYLYKLSWLNITFRFVIWNLSISQGLAYQIDLNTIQDRNKRPLVELLKAILCIYFYAFRPFYPFSAEWMSIRKASYERHMAFLSVFLDVRFFGHHILIDRDITLFHWFHPICNLFLWNEIYASAYTIRHIK